MIVEQREYQIRPAKLKEFWQLYQDVGLPIQTKYLPHPIGFFFPESGPTSRFIHMWGYENFGHREMCREHLHHDQDWLAYVKLSHKFIEQIDIRFLRLQNDAQVSQLAKIFIKQ